MRLLAARLHCAAAATLVASLLCAAATHAADGPPDPNASESWRLVRQSLFGNRPIVEDSGEVVELKAPPRAQDAAVVPVQLSTRIAQTPERYVKHLYLLIDKNPSPVAAIFTLTPQSGRADVETRVRVEEYTWMRAVAETSDGKLYLSKRFVKAAGGCSAPYATAPDFDAFKPRMKLKLDASTVPGEPSIAQLMIQHPNSSGLAHDQITHLLIPPYFVRTIEISYAGQPVMTAEVDFSISENPNFRFYFVPREGGELKAVAVDTKERRIEGVVQIDVAEPQLSGQK